LRELLLRLTELLAQLGNRNAQLTGLRTLAAWSHYVLTGNNISNMEIIQVILAPAIPRGGPPPPASQEMAILPAAASDFLRVKQGKQIL
jgi:hypothetical protein